ncbi:MAG TPA: hypothetical protein VGB26_12030 [Nitrospiria bacterium]|jgi:hypothetical protein
MKNHWRKINPNTLSLFLGVMILVGCASGNIHSVSLPENEEASIERVAVIPFQIGKTPEKQFAFKSSSVAPGAQEVITRLFWQRLNEKGDYRLASHLNVKKVLGEVENGTGTITSEKIKILGERLRVEGVVIGLIDVYEERKGTNYGVESPAAVGFVVQFYRVKDGQLLWKGSYYERQKSLMEDIRTFSLFLKRGGKWVTASDLADFGIRELIKRFPILKMKES